MKIRTIITVIIVMIITITIIFIVIMTLGQLCFSRDTALIIHVVTHVLLHRHTIKRKKDFSSVAAIICILH